MGKVTTEFDIDLVKWQAKIAQIKADQRAIELQAKQARIGDSLGGSMNGSGGGMGYSGRPFATGQGRAGAFAMANASAQVQDIAVQLQSGTSAITVATQQIPQLLSALGPQAGVLAGILAVGGALATVGYKGKEAFDKLISGARETDKEVGKLARTGSISDLERGVSKVTEQIDALAAKRASLNSIGGTISGVMGVFFGGDSRTEQVTKINDAKIEAERNLARLQEAAVNRSRDDLQIQELKAKGKEFEAGQLERMAEKEKAMIKIRDSGFDVATKAALMNDVDAAFKLKEEAAWTAELKRRNDDLNASRVHRINLIKEEASAADALRAQMQSQGFESDLKRQSPAGQAATLRGRAAELQRQGAAFEGEVTESQKLKLQIEINKLLERAAEIEGDAARREGVINAAKEQWALELELVKAKGAAGGKEDAKVKALEHQLRVMQLQAQLQQQLNIGAAEAGQMAEERVKAEESATEAGKQRQQNDAKISIAKQAAINHAKAHGHRTEAARLQREGEVEARAKQIETETGASPEEARAQAEKMQRDIDKINGVRPVIRGGRSSRSFEGLDGRSFPSLDAMEANRGKPLRDTFSFPGLDAMKNRGMGFSTGQIAPFLGPQNEKNAAAQNRAENTLALREGPQMVALLSQLVDNLRFA